MKELILVDLKKNPNVNDKMLIENAPLSSDEIMKYNSINNFLRKLSNERMMSLVEIISKESYISLRLLDWFVTKYAVYYDVLVKQKNGKNLNVRSSYNLQLAMYGKRYFDPFRRNKQKKKKKEEYCGKFYYPFDKNNKNKRILTTIAQLNFFKWLVEYDIISYIEKNWETINSEMTCYNKELQQNKIDKAILLEKDFQNTPVKRSVGNIVVVLN